MGEQTAPFKEVWSSARDLVVGASSRSCAKGLIREDQIRGHTMS